MLSIKCTDYLAIPSVYSIIFVVMKVKKKGKEKVAYTKQSSIAVDLPPASSPKYCITHEDAIEMEKEELKEVEEDGKDTEHEDKQVLLTSQDNSCDDTEM